MSTSEGKEECAMAVSGQKQKVSYVLIREVQENSLAVQWLGLRAFTARAWVQSPVRELTSCKPRSVAKTKREFKLKQEAIRRKTV